MICEPGKCCVCEKSVAAECPTCGSKRLSDEHTRVDVTWSNGSVMPIGVCRKCADDKMIEKDDVKRGVTEAHWKFWESMGATPDKEIVIV